jgi:hypothetical protein
MNRTLALGLAIALLACADTGSGGPRADTSAADDSLPRLATSGSPWTIRQLEVAPARFRPGGWSSEDALWGLVRGRLTRLDTRTGAVRTLPHDAWSIHGASGVTGWRNERGTWVLRDGGEPVRVAPAGVDSITGFDGPPTLLWSPDGSRALLGWTGEWDAAYDLLERDGSKRRLKTVIPGYYGNTAVLWLDSTRVLFQVVATGPAGGEPEYRESGWRGDLAVLDVRTGAYTRVTSVPDSVFLRVAGPHPAGVVVTEFGSQGPRAHWLYDPLSWRRRPTSVPNGRAFSSRSGAIVVLVDTQADSTTAVLVTGGATREIGLVPRDGEPAFTPSGRRGAMRTAGGVKVFEP